MIRISSPLILLMVALSACHSTPYADSTESESRFAVDSSSLQSRDELGRWKANPETMVGIRGMRALISAYPGSGLDGSLLRDSLDARMGAILERCTMEGEAHHALHDYLVPLMKLLHQLPDSPEPSQLDSISVHLALFDERFR